MQNLVFKILFCLLNFQLIEIGKFLSPQNFKYQFNFFKVCGFFKSQELTYYKYQQIDLPPHKFSEEQDIYCNIQITFGHELHQQMFKLASLQIQNADQLDLYLKEDQGNILFKRTNFQMEIIINVVLSYNDDDLQDKIPILQFELRCQQEQQGKFQKRLLQSCTGNTYYQAVYQKCLNCGQYCNGCTNYYQCNDCIQKDITGRYDYLYDKTCGSCNDGTSSGTWTNVCSGCSNKCTSCSNSGKICNGCKDSTLKINEELATCQSCDTANGWYITGNFCRRCPFQCATCTGPNNNQCLTCRSDIMKYPDGTCVYNSANSCTDGFYKSGMICLQCPTKCTKCSSASVCTQCEGGSYLMQNQLCGDCLVGNGEFINGLVCSSCSQYCKKCTNSTSCQECQNTYYLKEDNTRCIVCDTTNKQFKDGLYCRACDSSCLTCQDNTKCLSCPVNYYLTNNNQCLTCLQDGYYKDGSKCLACNPSLNCQKCNSPIACTGCISGKYIYSDTNNKCDICVDGYFISGSFCKSCNSNCQKCTDLATCQLCGDGYYVKDGYCAQCTPTKNCRTCQNDLACSSCNTDKYIQLNGSCDSCNDGYYIDGINCKRCSVNCQKCDSLGNCTKCDNGYYINLGQCTQCTGSLNCVTCSNSSTCSSCISGQYIQPEGKCDFCVDGYFIEGIYCRKCSSNCKKCNSVSDCILCEDGFFNNNGLCQACTPSLNCLTCQNSSACYTCNINQYLYSDGKCSQCSAGYYIDQKNCLKCKDNCSSCTSQLKCDKCQFSYSFEDISPNPNCIKCPSLKYYVDISEVCKKCREEFNCLTCNATKCITCDTTSVYKYLYPEDSQGKCGDCKENGFYLTSQQTCMSCDVSLNCMTCTNSTQCSTCKPNFYLNDESKCVSCNQDGLYIDGDKCKKCNPLCKTCSKDGCITCQPQNYLYPDKTCNACGDQFYIYGQLCKPCENNCFTCDNQTQCKTCKDSFFLYADKSCKNCVDGYYATPDKQCLQCTSSLNCKTCSNSTSCIDCLDTFYKNEVAVCVPCNEKGVYKKDKQCIKCKNELNCLTCEENKCLSCNTGQYIYNTGACAACQTENGFFIDTIFCTSCNSLTKCKTCNNPTECLSCYSPSKLQIDKSCGDCKQGFFADGDTCKPCNVYLRCKSCLDGISCDSCPDNLYLDQNLKCIECNTEGVYRDDTTKKCIQCNSTCKTCVNGSECLSCQNGYYQYDDNTCKTCDKGFYIDGSRCKKCNTMSIFCTTCTNYTSCLTCQDGYYLDENKICVKCDVNGFYRDGTECKRCPSSLNCLTCKIGNECDSCNGTDKIQSITKNCAPCGQGFYVEGQFCKKCNDSLNCQSCSNGISCDTCKPGAFLMPNNSCGVCQDGFYANPTNNRCDPCYLNCKTCSGGKENDCKSCLYAKEYLHAEGKCAMCPDGNGYKIQDIYCLKCATNCQVCSGVSTIDCISCQSGYSFQYDGRCDICNKTDSKYIGDQNKCLNCHSFCKECRDGTQHCDKCNDNYYFNELSNCDICYKSQGYYTSGAQCLKCNENCKTCKGGTKFDCESCPEGKQFFYNKDGTKECVLCATEYKFYISGGDCLPCHESCQICKGSNDTDCSTCAAPYSFDTNNKCKPCTQDGWYSNGIRCQQCSPNCKKCRGPGVNDCDECMDNFQFYDLDNSCTPCPAESNYKYIEPSSGRRKCGICDQSCKECTGPTINDCTICKAGLQRQPDRTCKICDTQKKYYITIENNVEVCKYCNDSCQQCNGPLNTNCTLCNQGEYFYITDVITSTKICQQCLVEKGYFINNQYCVKCDQTCATCSGGSSSNCQSCTQPLALYDNFTCQNCPNEGYFITSQNLCKKCHSDCLVCDGITAMDCKKCAGNRTYSVEKKQCITCPTKTGYFIEDFQCKKCHDNCMECINEQNKDCPVCTSGYYKLPDTSCSVCNVNNQYFISGQNCINCHQTCKTCTGPLNTDCTQCLDGYHMEETLKQCVKCDLYGDHYIDGQFCKKCHSTCASCFGPNPDDCKQCNTNLYFKTWQIDTNGSKQGYGKCESCGDSYFIEKSLCIQCDNTCQTCKGSSETDCMLCKPGLYKNQERKCKSCDLTQPFFIDNVNCIPCTGNCQTCSNGNPNGCNSCKTGFYKKQGEDQGLCLECPIEGYVPINSQECFKCHPTCKTCFNESSQGCKECQPNFYRKEPDQLLCQSCPLNDQYFIDNDLKNCLKCHESCQTCTSKSNLSCQSCSLGYKFNSDRTQCIKCAVDNGYFIQGDFCLKCNDACLTCNGPTDRECIRCANNKYKKQDDGYVKCDDCFTDQKYFKDEINQRCTKCDSSCKSCFGSQKNQCFECESSPIQLYFHSDKTCKECPSINFYIQDKNCIQCHSTCMTCKGSYSTDCLTCQTNKYFKEDTPQGMCSDCPSERYFIFDQQCKKCHDSCLTCKGSTSKDCNKCQGLTHFLPEGICGDCLPNFYVDPADNTCKQCHISCETCNGPFDTQCIKCKNGQYFNNLGKCDICNTQEGFFISTVYCKACHQTCKTCSSDSFQACDVCKNGLYKKQDDGYISCQNCEIDKKYFIDSFDNNKCKKCHESCQSCTQYGDTSCTDCISGYKKMPDNRCQACPDKKYFVENQFCKPCFKDCLTCRAEGIDQCIQCESGLSFDSNKICMSCNVKDGQFIDSSNNCKNCDKSCLTCNGIGETQCIKCRNNLYKDENGKCNPCDIENGYYIQGDYCKKCNSTCKKCKDSGAENNCIECNGDRLLYLDNTCKPCDPTDGFYVVGNDNPNLRRCFACHIDCKSCEGSGQNQCLTCRQQNTFFDQNHICRRCHKDCNTCIGPNQNQCESCLLPKKYLSSDTNICSICKQNEFNDGKKCITCSPDCMKCTSYEVCLDCGNGTHIQKDKYCGECDENEYVNEQNVCKPCHTDCQSCIGPQNIHCQKCIDSDLRITRTNICGKCDSNQYSDFIRCYDCHKDCNTCIGANNAQCTSCKDPTKYNCNKKDIEQFGLYHGAKKCQKSCLKCHENCLTCFGEAVNQCMTCAVGILQQDFSCSKWCPKGQYFDEVNKSCEDCDANCQMCTNTHECTLCEKEYTLYLGDCFKCPDHYFLDKPTKTCKECHSTCKTCFGQKANECIDCMDDKAFLDQFNTCVYDCAEGYKKNPKNRKCQECVYQKNPDQSIVCVLECQSNQFVEQSSRMCISCINQCTKCTSLTHCTECSSGLFFANKNQESCRQCEINEFINSKDQCEVCPFLNCLKCNEQSCIKCIYQFKVDDSTGQCVYDKRYDSYECKGVSKTDNSCEEEIKFIDKSDLILKSSQYSSIGIQVVGSLTVGTGSFVGYTFQMQQLLGNNMFYKEKIKTLSIGPTFYEQNYQMNILSMVPNPLSYISSYNNFINGDGKSSSSANPTNKSNKSIVDNKFKDNRILKNELTQNGLSFVQSRDLSKSFIDSFIIYLIFMSIFGLIILICNQIDPKRHITFEIIQEKKYSILISIQQIFSNYIYVAIFKSIQELDFYNLSTADYISISLQFIYIVAYLFFALRILQKIQNYDRKNEDLEEVKIYMSLIKNLMTEVSYNKYFWYFFELRKVFTLFFIFMIPNVIASSILLLFLNLFFVLYHFLKKPFFILSEQRYFYTLETLNLINNVSLTCFLITDQKICAWLTLLTLILINVVILGYTVVTVLKTLYIKFFQKRFIISTNNQSDIDYKWKEINQNNIKGIKYIKQKQKLQHSSPLKSALDRSTNLGDSMNLSNIQSVNEYPVDLNELSIKWSMNPIYVRHIALQEFPKEEQNPQNLANYQAQSTMQLSSKQVSLKQ